MFGLEKVEGWVPPQQELSVSVLQMFCPCLQVFPHWVSHLAPTQVTTNTSWCLSLHPPALPGLVTWWSSCSLPSALKPHPRGEGAWWILPHVKLPVPPLSFSWIIVRSSQKKQHNRWHWKFEIRWLGLFDYYYSASSVRDELHSQPHVSLFAGDFDLTALLIPRWIGSPAA